MKRYLLLFQLNAWELQEYPENVDVAADFSQLYCVRVIITDETFIQNYQIKILKKYFLRTRCEKVKGVVFFPRQVYIHISLVLIHTTV